MSPESATEFLLLCLRGRWQPESLAAARDLARQPGFDWPAALAVARREFISPLLYHILRSADLLPPTAEAALRRAYDHNARRNLFLFHELAAALGALSSGGLPVVVLKGAALAQTVYPNPALRPLRDLDLLIRREAVAEALPLLARLGYAAPRPEVHPGATVEYENEVLLVKRASLNVPLELHWSLIDSPYYQRALPADEFWAATLPFPGGPAGVLILQPEAQLLHLCAHLHLHHTGAELLWLHDVAELVYGTSINWPLVTAQAQAHDLVLPVQQVLAQVAADWHAPVPAEALAALQALRPSAAETQVYAHLTAPERPAARRLWADLSALGGWPERLRFALGNVFPAPGYMRRRYHIAHSWLLPLYYPYRWYLGLRGLGAAPKPPQSN